MESPNRNWRREMNLMVSSRMCLLKLNTNTEHKQVPLLDRSAPSMQEIVVTKEGVTKLLKGLNPSEALGPDELHPRVLKEFSTELGPVFAHLFQQSIDTSERSLANICPPVQKG